MIENKGRKTMKPVHNGFYHAFSVEVAIDLLFRLRTTHPSLIHSISIEKSIGRL